MPGPREEQRRSTEFSPEREEDHGVTVNKALSSKKVEDAQTNDEARENKIESQTRARRPRSGRSGSDSNAGRRSRSH